MTTDPHDPRRFRVYAQLAPDGTVLAIRQVADGMPAPPDTAAALHLDVTPLGPVDFTGVTIAPVTIAARDPTAILAALKTANKVPAPKIPNPVALDGG